MDTKISQKPLGMLSKRSVFRACNLNTFCFFFLLIQPESSFSHMEEWQKSSQTVWRISLDKRRKLLQFLFFFFASTEKKYNIHPEIWYYVNKTKVMPFANWALSTWFISMFVSALGAVWGLLLVHVILPFICNHLASIDIICIWSRFQISEENWWPTGQVWKDSRQNQ